MMSPRSSDLYRDVSELLRAGRARDAERVCRQILGARPNDPARFHYALAFTLIAQHRAREAEIELQHAVTLDPAHAEARHTLAMLLQQRGDLEGAAAHLARAAEAPGATAEVLHNLGALRWQRGEVRPALVAFRRAVELRPDFASAWHAVGLAHRALNENDEAIEALRRAVALAPEDAAMHVALAQVLLELNMDGAALSLAKAAALAPGDPAIADAHAMALAAAGQLEAALREHQRARALAPDALPLVLSHARTLADCGQQNAAAALCRNVIEAPGAHPREKSRAEFQLAALAMRNGEIDAARRAFNAALTLTPEDAGARLQRGMLLLSLGEFGQGWRDFEARFAADMRAGGILAQPFPQPRWEGSDLSGKTILVWSEQGVGDDIIFASMLGDLARRAAKVLLHVDARLVPLFARSLPANVVAYPRVLPVQPELLSPAIASQIALGSLGQYLRPDWPSFGAPRAYLHANPDAVERCRRRYAVLPGLKVGIAWRSRNLVNGRVKSSDLSLWGPILHLPGVSFVNLQYGDCRADLDRARAAFGVEIFADPEVDQLVDMDGFAAQVASLDLVISVSNAIAHTAGALGVPTFVLLASDPLWVWFRGRVDSPWYPQVRLFRQARAGEWEQPVTAIARTIEAYRAAGAADMAAWLADAHG